MAPIPTSPAAPHCVFCALLFAQQETFPRWSHLTLPNHPQQGTQGDHTGLDIWKPRFACGDPMLILEPDAGPEDSPLLTLEGKGCRQGKDTHWQGEYEGHSPMSWSPPRLLPKLLPLFLPVTPELLSKQHPSALFSATHSLAYEPLNVLAGGVSEGEGPFWVSHPVAPNREP